MIDLNLKERDFEFMVYLSYKELTLSQIKEKLGITKWEVQRIFNNLNKSGMLISRKEGRKRMVRLSRNGHYFNDWYQRNKIKISNKNGK